MFSYQGPLTPEGVTRRHFGAVAYEGKIWLFSSKAVYNFNPLLHTWTTYTNNMRKILSGPVIYQNKICFHYSLEDPLILGFKTYNTSTNTFEDFKNIPDITPFFITRPRDKFNRLFAVDI